MTLRKVSYQDEQNCYYDFLANNFDISTEDVAFLYIKRWGIEILFKKMKQNFQLHYFYGENENSIYTQAWCTLIAQLLFILTQKIAQTKKASPVVTTLDISDKQSGWKRAASEYKKTFQKQIDPSKVAILTTNYQHIKHSSRID